MVGKIAEKELGQAQVLAVEHWQLEFFIAGNGPEPLIAFHGFGQSADDYSGFIELLGERFTLVLVNLFHHGNSKSSRPSDEEQFDAAALRRVFTALLERLAYDKVSLVGYSLGGRVCLKLLETAPERINRMILLAPDGLRMSSWYRFVTATRFGGFLFKRAVKNPAGLFAVSGFIRRIGILGSKQYTFARENFNSPEKRRLVYDVWMFFRFLIPDLDACSRQARKHGIMIDLVFGRYDRIIPPSFGRALLIRARSNVVIHILECGHQLLRRKTAEALLELSGSIK